MDPDFPEVDVMGEFRAVHNKYLKKRFFRKPNVPAAREAYRSLAYHCQREELPKYAAMCWTATAKSERDVGNPVGERACHVRAAKQCMSEELEDYKQGFVSPFRENLHNALHSYEQAKETYATDSSIRVCFDLTMANALDKVGIKSLQQEYLESACNLAKDNPQLKLDCLSKKAGNNLETGDLESALEAYNEIAEIIEAQRDDARYDLLLNSEITRVLIVMILKPSPDLLNQKLVQLLDRYTWGTHDDEHFKDIGMSTDLFILMQSLVLACQSSDPYSNLDSIEWEFWKYLNVQQKNLLRTLVRSYRA